jgi:hypothetical protein
LLKKFLNILKYPKKVGLKYSKAPQPSIVILW